MTRRRAHLAWSVALLAAAVLFTAVIIRYSQRHGRLMLFPTFDDTRYMLEGLSAHHALRDGGPAGLVRYWLADPPHSPYQATLGLLGFTILGTHDWAAHAASALLILGLLAAARWALRGLPWLLQLPLLILALTLPLAAVGVYEFRPDIAVGIALAFAVTWTLSRPLFSGSPRHQFAVGALFGLCLLIKPPFFPLTLLAFSLCAGLKAVEQRRTAGCCAGRIIAAAVRCLVGCVVVAGPYWIVAGAGQWRYFHDVSFGRYKGLWNLPGDDRLRPLYYLTGEGTQMMLGGHLVPLAILCAAGLAVVLYRRRRRELHFAISMLIVGGVFWAVPTASRKSPFFGVPLQMMLVFGGLVSARMMLFRRRQMCDVRCSRFLAPGLAWILALTSLLIFRWPEHRGDFNSPEILSRRDIVEGIYAPIRARAAAGPTPPRVFVSTAGDITARLISYLAIKDDLAVESFDHPNESSLELFRQSIGRADFVIASESGSDLVAASLPSARVQDQVLALLRRDPRFREVADRPFIRTGRGYYLFERTGPAPMQTGGMTR